MEKHTIEYWEVRVHDTAFGDLRHAFNRHSAIDIVDADTGEIVFDRDVSTLHHLFDRCVVKSMRVGTTRNGNPAITVTITQPENDRDEVVNTFATHKAHAEGGIEYSERV